MRLSILFAPALILASAGGTTGCVSNSIEDFANSDRELKLEEYFLGDTSAYGIFEDRFGKVRRQFKVDITGTYNNSTLTLVEDFTYDDGELDTRTWVIEVLGDGNYRGTANDVPGPAIGRAMGNAFHWEYSTRLKVDGDTWTVGFDDWMYLLDDNVLINRATVTRFGIRIGEVTIAFQKDER